MTLLILAMPFALVFAPWQQNLPGEGRVIEYDPVDRPQPIQARTDGVLLKWHVREGQNVKAGDPIVDLADNDPSILERLRDQLTAAGEKRAASVRKRDQYAGRVDQATQAREAAMRVADDQIRAAEQAVEVAKQGLAAAEESVKHNAFLETMFEGLVQERIAPGFELQRAKQQSGVARAELRARTAGIAAAEAQLQAAKSNRARVENDEQAKVQSAFADRDAASGDVADADGAVLRLERDLERQRQQSVLAPADGFVQRLFANGQGGGFVKSGATLALLVPRCPSLRCLHLGWCDVSDRGLLVLAHLRSSLTALDLSGCSRVSDRGVHHRALPRPVTGGRRHGASRRARAEKMGGAGRTRAAARSLGLGAALG
jgi:multidrug efflux pump subunit AcrA (membrane-fusion protein)